MRKFILNIMNKYYTIRVYTRQNWEYVLVDVPDKDNRGKPKIDVSDKD